ncbi:MAG: flap endonuclease-1 [Desulfurococcales archaeon]|nr:flap endonuclease-1 [Desulfurococcales archaeon]
MGVNLRELIPEGARRTIDLRALSGRVVALDAYNMLYQFLAAIRQPDGTPLMDRQGRVTSHLSGLFYRTINLAEEGVKPVYVFDGKPPEMKKAELEERIKRREEAARRYRQALEAGRIEEARKYAQATGRLTSDMVGEAKRLLEAMGIPYVQAPAEGEAQAACMAAWGDAWAAGSQDYDSLLFGAPRLVRNLAITGRRKLPGRDEYVEVKPELIELEALLEALGITRDHLIVIGILLGTDYNPGGVRGYGPKTALRLVRGVRDPVELLRKLPAGEAGGADPVRIFEYFKNPPCTRDYKVEFRPPNEAMIRRILVEEHDFNPNRVEKAVERLKKAYREHLRARQARLDQWFS